MRAGLILLALCFVAVCSAYHKELGALDCDGHVHILAGTVGQVKSDFPKNIFNYGIDRLKSRVDCQCAMDDAEFRRSFVPGFETLLNMLSPTSDTSTACTTPMPKSFHTPGVPVSVEFPSTCTYDSYVNGEGCYVQVPTLDSSPIDWTFNIAAKQCPDSYLPYFSLSCDGVDCENIGMPCTADSDCTSGATCVDLFTAEQLFSVFQGMALYDSSDTSPGCGSADFISDVFNEMYSWYKPTEAAMAGRQAKMCLPNFSAIEAAAQEIWAIDTITTAESSVMHSNDFCTNQNDCKCCECDGCDDNNCNSTMTGCMNSGSYTFCNTGSYPKTTVSMPGLLTAWDGTYTDNDGTSTSATSAAHLDGSYFTDEELEYPAFDGKVTVWSVNGCTGTVTSMSSERYASAFSFGQIRKFASFLMESIKKVQDCRGDGSALSIEQFRTRFELHHLEPWLYQLTKLSGSFNLGKDMSDWVLVNRRARLVDQIYYTLAGVDPATGPEDSSYDMTTRLKAWVTGNRPHEVRAAQAIDALAKLFPAHKTTKQHLETWATDSTVSDAIHRLFPSLKETDLRWFADEEESPASRSLLQTTTGSSEGGMDGFAGVVMPETCTFENYGTKGCKIQFTALDSLFGLTNGIDIEFKMGRCSSSATSEGLPKMGMNCVGALCEAFARPTPCVDNSGCTNGLSCIDFASLIGTLGDPLGNLLFSTPTGCDTNGDFEEDAAGNVCVTEENGKKDLRSVFLYMANIPADDSSDLKFCMFDINTVINNAAQWGAERITANSDSTITVNGLEALSPATTPPIELTIGVGGRRRLLAEFDSDQFAADLAAELGIAEDRIEVTSVEWIDDSTVKVTMVIEEDTAASSDVDSAAALDALLREVETMATSGTLPNGSGGTTVAQIEVEGWTSSASIVTGAWAIAVSVFACVFLL